MSDQPTRSSAPAGSLLESFTPVPYRADGSVSFGGGLQLIGILGIVGIILGVIASFISRFFYFVVLFPIAIGMGVGWAGSSCIKRFHVRNPLLCGLAGFIAGCLAMLTMHYADFKHYEQELSEQLGEEGRAVQQIALRIDEIHANWENATPDEQAIVTELETNPEGLRALRANTFWRYIDLMAHQGVEINPGAGGGAGRGLNLGYTGSYLYWLIEAAIVAGIAFTLMSGAANEPYCGDCGAWKQGFLYGPFSDTVELARHVKEGTLIPFAAVPVEGAADGMVTVYTCPESDAECPVDVRVERWTVNSKGETSKKRLAQMTYPPGALASLQVACAPLMLEEPETSKEVSADSDAPDES